MRQKNYCVETFDSVVCISGLINAMTDCTRYEAVGDCYESQSTTGKLAVIDDSSTHSEIVRWLNDVTVPGNVQGIWIGLQKREWQWIDGKGSN